MNKNPLFPHITVNLKGPEGNAYVIMGIVSYLMKRMGKTQEEIEAVHRDMKSSDYKHLCEVASNYIRLVED